MLRAYLYLLLFIPLTFCLAVSSIFFTLLDSTGRFYHYHARLWGRLGIMLGGVRVKVAGLENIPSSGPVIYMSNHQGNFDILALLAKIPRQFAWIAKEELFRIPVFGHSMARAGYIPLDRGDGRRALRSMEIAADMIRKGKSVVIFPEGTRSNDGELLPFKRGGFLLAEKAGVAIVPVSIDGSWRINPPKQLRLYPGPMTVRFGKPVPTSGEGAPGRGELPEVVRRAIAAGMEEERAAGL
jgi:1-acyl-sn-glycerol-3-phosphate acyltransferase